MTERKEREKLEILLAKERIEFEKELAVERLQREKELEVERGRREKEVAAVKEEVAAVKEEASKRLLDFITSSSYKGLRDLVEVRNGGD